MAHLQLVGEENPVDAGLEGFGRVCFYADSHHFPSFSFTLNKGILRGDRLVAVHVQVDLFRSRIAVVPEHDLLGGFQGFHLRRYLDADRNRCGASGCFALASFQIVRGYFRDSPIR